MAISLQKFGKNEGETGSGVNRGEFGKGSGGEGGEAGAGEGVQQSHRGTRGDPRAYM